MSPRKRICPHAPQIRALLQIFAALLSPRQRMCLVAHHLEGRSLSEIARELGISRQAVLDTVRHGENHLIKIANCLAAVGMSLTGESPPQMPKLEAVIHALDDLRDRVAREGIIYSPRWIVDELDRILAALRLAHEHQETSKCSDT
ncbi:MAG: helix-turn-helix domain-containing protein [Candidatus Sumerlaeaceae bacterium]|nr:helix-turn-helix domain-containing protein [Candidatus Sumerlaeaceae bacterium]